MAVMTEKKSLIEMRKQNKDYGSIDILSACQHKTLRYYFVREEQQTKKIEDTSASRIENLLRMALSSHDKALAAFEEAVLAWKESDPKTIDAIKQLNEQYKDIVTKHVEKAAEVGPLTQINPDDLDYILTLVHDRNIENVDRLNEYKPWTAEVYGETSFAFAKQMCEELKIGKDDTFLDLGSGVGRVVMQVAALYHCKKSVGIELLETRAKFAEGMDTEFRSLMAWLGKMHGEYTLIHADFLNHRDVIADSNIIFCNNFAFDDKLNYKLKTIFADQLAEGVRILVSKSLRDEKFRITEKTENDGAAVIPVRRTFQGKMSWTDNPVTFYLHEVDSSVLARFQESRKDPAKRAAYEEEQRQLRPKYYESSSEQSQDMDPDLTEEENISPTGKRGGCTTRSQWKSTVKRRRAATENNESDDEDSENTNSEASTQRTRSIPSHESSAVRNTSKRKRGRPTKSSARSAPSSTSDTALQTLFTHTVKSINTVDRSIQQGCESGVVTCAPSDDLPPEYRSCLKSIEAAMKTYHRAAQAASFPGDLEARIQADQIQIDQLKDRERNLNKEVSVLRTFCKKLVEALFKARNLPLPSSSDDLGRDSRNILQTTNLLRERHSTLKDDVYWLENTHNQEKAQFDQTVLAVNGRPSPGKVTAPFMVNGAFSGYGPGGPGPPPANEKKKSGPTSGRQTHPAQQNTIVNGSSSAGSHRSQGPPTSSNAAHEFVKPRIKTPDAVDLTRIRKKEGPISRGLQSYNQSTDPVHRANTPNKVTSSRQSTPSSQHGSGSHSKQHPSHSTPNDPGQPTFMSELGRVIESSLLGPSSTTSATRETLSSSTTSSVKPEGNLRGPSPSVAPRQSQQRSDPSPSREKLSNAASESPSRSYPASSRGPPAQVTHSYAIPTIPDSSGRNYPNGAIIHGEVVYPGAIVGAAHPTYPPALYGNYAMTPAAGPYGAHAGGIPPGYNAQVETHQMIPGWGPSQQYSSVSHFDSAAVAGAFSGVPGQIPGSTGSYTAMKYHGQPHSGLEPISPPPR